MKQSFASTDGSYEISIQEGFVDGVEIGFGESRDPSAVTFGSFATFDIDTAEKIANAIRDRVKSARAQRDRDVSP